jgi:hypothetical protein
VALPTSYRSAISRDTRASTLALACATLVVFSLALAGNAEVAAAAKPVNTSSPTISGAAQVGQVLTADPGTWSGTQPITYTYDWQRCNARGNACKSIAGAGRASYTLTSADEGATMRVRVVARNADGSGSATSAPTRVVQAAPKLPANTSPPTVSGSTRVGETLQASPGA